MFIPKTYTDIKTDAEKKSLRRWIFKWLMAGILIRLTFMPFTMHGDLMDYIRAGYHIAYEGHYLDVYQHERRIFNEKGPLIETLFASNGGGGLFKTNNAIASLPKDRIDLGAGDKRYVDYSIYFDFDFSRADEDEVASLWFYRPDQRGNYEQDGIRLGRTRLLDEDRIELTEFKDGKIISMNSVIIDSNVKRFRIDIKSAPAQKWANISFFSYNIALPEKQTERGDRAQRKTVDGNTVMFAGPYTLRWDAKPGKRDTNNGLMRFHVNPSGYFGGFAVEEVRHNDLDYKLDIFRRGHLTKDSENKAVEMKAYSVMFDLLSDRTDMTSLWFYSLNKQGNYENNAIRVDRIGIDDENDLIEATEFKNGKVLSKNFKRIKRSDKTFRMDIEHLIMDKQANISLYYYDGNNAELIAGPYLFTAEQLGKKIHFSTARAGNSGAPSDYLNNFRIEEVGPHRTGNISSSSYPPLVYYFSAITLTLSRPVMLIKGYVEKIKMFGTYEAWFSYGNVYRNIFIMKLPFLFLDLAVAFLLLRLVDTGERGLSAFKLWMINPFAIYSSFIHGQYDIIPVFFVVIALLCANRNRPYAMSFFIGVGAAIKSWPFLLLLPAVLLVERDLWKRIKLFAFGLSPYIAVLIPFQLKDMGRMAAKQTMGAQINDRFTQLHLFIGRSEFTAGVEDIVYIFFLLYALIMLHIYIKREAIIRDGHGAVLRYWTITMVVLFSTIFFHPQWFLWLTPLLILLFAEHKALRGAEMLWLLFGCWLAYNSMFGRPSEGLLFKPISPRFILLPSLKEFIPRMGIIAHIGRSVLIAAMIYIVAYVSFRGFFRERHGAGGGGRASVTPRLVVASFFGLVAAFAGMLFLYSVSGSADKAVKIHSIVWEFLSRASTDKPFMIFYALLYGCILFLSLRRDDAI